MGSIPVGSTKKQTQTCLLLLSLRRIERLLTQPDSRALDKLADEREYKKADTDVPAFAIPTWNRRTAFRRPDSRTLGRLAAIREYQNDCEDSRFYMMKRKGWRFRTHKKYFDSRFFFSLSIILLLNVFWFLNQSMPDKNNTNRGQDVVFLTNTALHSRLRHKVLTRSRALSLPENTASDSRATKSSQNRTKIKKRSEKIDQ